MKKIYLAFVALCVGGNLLAQMPAGGGRGGQNMNMGHFYGKVIDDNTGKPLEAVSIQLTQNKMDTATKKRRDYVVPLCSLIRKEILLSINYR